MGPALLQVNFFQPFLHLVIPLVIIRISPVLFLTHARYEVAAVPDCAAMPVVARASALATASERFTDLPYPILKGPVASCGAVTGSRNTILPLWEPFETQSPVSLSS